MTPIELRAQYTATPIPDMTGARERRVGYRQWPINLDDSRNQEPLVDARKYGLNGENFYHSNSTWYGGRVPGSIPELYLREGVAEKFAKIQTDVLKPMGLGIFIYDAWRPQDVQRYFHDDWFPRVIKAKNPTWNDDQIEKEVERFWSRPLEAGVPIDYQNPSPHSTGAVLDLTLVDHNGHPLFTGNVFDDVRDDGAYPDSYERIYNPKGDYNFTDMEAQRMRRLSYHIWDKSEFQQNPNEIWHVSYGDQLWAKVQGVPAAFYSYTEPK